jgi:uncharacterized protein (UPF0297 family)
MPDSTEKTMNFQLSKDKDQQDVIMTVFEAMKEKGYDPINQIVGYLLSGDPTYITSHNNARYLIRRVERDELIEKLLRFYVREHGVKLD